MIKLKNILKEILVNNPLDLHTFVKTNKIKILEILEKNIEDFEDSTGIEDIEKTIVEGAETVRGIYGGGLMFYNDSFNEKTLDEVHEVVISNPNAQDHCTGIAISDLDSDYWDNFFSSREYEILPNIIFKGKPLYYRTLWC